ncbi:MAG: hypothetical protein LBK73_05080 [Treponema sp.]|nr:hypothetical protein [Treponema sp.]
MLQNLDGLTTSVESALDAAKNETTRTPVATARRKEAFDTLSNAIQDTCRRGFGDSGTHASRQHPYAKAEFPRRRQWGRPT